MFISAKAITILSLFSSVALADAYDCTIRDLVVGKELSKFSLIPPKHNNEKIELPNGDQLEVWSYNTSVGVNLTKLPTNKIISSQMNFDGSGSFRMVFESFDLYCESAR
jgi:hypothetical protein